MVAGNKLKPDSQDIIIHGKKKYHAFPPSKNDSEFPGLKKPFDWIVILITKKPKKVQEMLTEMY